MVAAWDFSNWPLNLPGVPKRMPSQCRWLSQCREQQNKVGILPEGWQMKVLLEVNYSSFEVLTVTTGISQPIAHVIDIIWNKWHRKGCLCVNQIPSRWQEVSKRGQNMWKKTLPMVLLAVSTLGHLSICEGQSELSKMVRLRLNWYDGNKIQSWTHNALAEPLLMMHAKIGATHCTSENLKDARKYATHTVGSTYTEALR